MTLADLLCGLAKEHNRLVDLWHCQGVRGYWDLHKALQNRIAELRQQGDDSACLNIACYDYPKICGISVGHTYYRVPTRL